MYLELYYSSELLRYHLEVSRYLKIFQVYIISNLFFALFFIIVPNYYTLVSNFLEDFFTLKPYPGIANIHLPYPSGNHDVVYETVMRFCLIFGVFQFFVLGLRFFFKSAISKVAETASNIVTWVGGAYMFNLLHLRATNWIPFLGGMIAFLGLSLLVRSLIVLAASIFGFKD